MNDWLQLVGSGLLLYFGGEWFVGGASTLAVKLRVPQILVGLTVVAYGTSAPEIIVGLRASSAGHGEIALGNVIGSNTANIGLILGIAVLVRPARVDGALRRRELPALVASAAVIPPLLLDGVVRRWEAICLLLFALGYTIWMIRAALDAGSLDRTMSDARATQSAADAAGAPEPAGALRAGGTCLAGLGVLLVGGNTFVQGAVSAAQAWGMSEHLVGLTIVALGTSLPELVTSVIAARRGHSDLAIGNVVGSNIFNTFLGLGTAALAGHVGSPLETLWLDLAALLVITGFASALIRSERIIARFEGGVALLLYFGFIAMAAAKG